VLHNAAPVVHNVAPVGHNAAPAVPGERERERVYIYVFGRERERESIYMCLVETESLYIYVFGRETVYIYVFGGRGARAGMPVGFGCLGCGAEAPLLMKIPELFGNCGLGACP